MSQSFFAVVGVPMCFAQLNSNEAVDRATISEINNSDAYLRGPAVRRFADALLRLFVTGFLVFAVSNNCRMPCSNSRTALSKAPSCPTRTIAMDGCRSNDGGRNTFTVSME